MTRPDIGVTPIPYTRLGVKYLLIALYGLSASIVGVTTIGIVGGNWWETIWPMLVSIFALGAFFGVLRSKYYGKEGLEASMTLAVVALLASYSLAIILRTHFDNEVIRLPIAFLPIILSVMPFARFMDIVRNIPGRKK